MYKTNLLPYLFTFFYLFYPLTGQAETTPGISIGLRGDMMNLVSSKESSDLQVQFNTVWNRNLLLSMKAFKSSHIGFGMDWVGLDIDKDLRKIMAYYAVKKVFFYFERGIISGTFAGTPFQGESTRTDIRYAGSVFLMGGFIKVKEGPRHRDPNFRATTVGFTWGTLTYLNALQGEKNGACKELIRKRLGLCMDTRLDVGIISGTFGMRYASATVYREGTSRLEAEREFYLDPLSNFEGFLLWYGNDKQKVYTVGRLGMHVATTSIKFSYNQPFIWGPVVDFGGHF